MTRSLPSLVVAALLLAGAPGNAQEGSPPFDTATVDGVGTLAFSLLRVEPGGGDGGPVDLDHSASVRRDAARTVTRVI